MATIRGNVAGSGYGNVYVDSLIWGGNAWDMSTGSIKVAFGYWENREAFEQFHGTSPYVEYGHKWINGENNSVREIDTFAYAMSVYESVCGVTFDFANSVEEANLVWWKSDAGNYDGKSYHETLSADQNWGFIDNSETSWNFQIFGGDGLHTALQIVGLGLGLAKPHDGGQESDASTFPGATGSRSTGTHGLNQGVYTVMSDNTGWDGIYSDAVRGAQGELGAFDIAALQALYGPNMSTNTGDDIYELPTFTAATRVEGWACIWDAGGNDTIRSADVHAPSTIDLRAATLVNGDPNAGGFLSKEADVAGGFTIANGVVIENATGGRSGDTLYGNDVANVLRGNGGNDTLYGGAGDDTAVFSGNRADYTITSVGGKTVVTDKVANRDGTDTLDSISFLKFADATGPGGTPQVPTGTTHPGSESNDVIRGTARNDVINGFGGDDRLYGGRGKDTLFGGPGKDVFVFKEKADARKTHLDKIVDFNVKDDTIWLDNAVFKKLGSRGSESKPAALKSGYFKAGSAAQDANDYIIYDKKKGILYYDADGNGAGKALQIATLTKNLKMTYKDFFVI